ncbi:hypothetical protein D3C78_1231250 [compost metagenome]
MVVCADGRHRGVAGGGVGLLALGICRFRAGVAVQRAVCGNPRHRQHGGARLRDCRRCCSACPAVAPAHLRLGAGSRHGHCRWRGGPAPVLPRRYARALDVPALAAQPAQAEADQRTAARATVSRHPADWPGRPDCNGGHQPVNRHRDGAVGAIRPGRDCWLRHRRTS